MLGFNVSSTSKDADYAQNKTPSAIYPESASSPSYRPVKGGTFMLITSQGCFSGYASIFGEPDQGGDIVLPGAFKRSLNKPGRSDVRLLFQHDPKEPVGRIMQVKEDQTGLFVKGQLFAQVPRARALMSLVAGRGVDGLSIGFRTQKARRDKRTGFRHLIQIDLWEISIVTFPMMERARIIPGTTSSDKSVRQNRSPHETIGAAISLLTN